MVLSERKGFTFPELLLKSLRETRNGKVSAIQSWEDPTGSAHGCMARNNVRRFPPAQNSSSLHVLMPVPSSPPLPVALEQYHASLTSGDPWGMADDQGDESGQDQYLRPTNSARRVKDLFEQVTGQPILLVHLSPP